MDGTNLTITGRFARDPNPPRSVGQSKVTTVVIAVHRTAKVNGEQTRATDYWEVDVWGETAELASTKPKGSLAVISGTFDGHRTWDANGRSGLVYKLRPHHAPSAVMFFDLAGAQRPASQNGQHANGSARGNGANGGDTRRASSNGGQRQPATAAASGGFDWNGLEGPPD